MLQGLGAHVPLLASLASPLGGKLWSNSGQGRGQVMYGGYEGCARVTNGDADKFDRPPVSSEGGQ